MNTEQKLSGIYEFEMRIFRHGDDRAVMVPKAGTSLCVVRPWPWQDDPTRIAWPQLSLAQSTSVAEVVNAPPGRVAAIDLGALLVWASRRREAFTRWLYDDPPTERYAEVGRQAVDAQLVAGEPFNRCLIREALQTFVEAGCVASSVVMLEWALHGPGSLLRMRADDLVVVVMSMKRDVECGDEPLPVEWSER